MLKIKNSCRYIISVCIYLVFIFSCGQAPSDYPNNQKDKPKNQETEGKTKPAEIKRELGKFYVSEKKIVLNRRSKFAKPTERNVFLKKAMAEFPNRSYLLIKGDPKTFIYKDQSGNVFSEQGTNSLDRWLNKRPDGKNIAAIDKLIAEITTYSQISVILPKSDSEEQQAPFLSKHPRPALGTKQTSYEVGIMRNNNKAGEWVVIGEIQPKSIHVEKSGFSDVDVLNAKILEFIAKQDAANDAQSISFSASEGSLKVRLLDIAKYRRCTVYLFLQESPNGNRLLAYGSTLIKHHAASFGTSLESVTMESIKDHLAKENIKLPKPINYFVQ